MVASSLACLALAIYIESRNQPENGQVAVGYTIINRTSHPGFPKTICKVVGSAEFTWNKKAKIKEPEAYSDSLKLAGKLLKHEVQDPTHGALYFHHQRVHPKWASKMQRITKIGKHIFYKDG